MVFYLDIPKMEHNECIEKYKIVGDVNRLDFSNKGMYRTKLKFIVSSRNKAVSEMKWTMKLGKYIPASPLEIVELLRNRIDPEDVSQLYCIDCGRLFIFQFDENDNILVIHDRTKGFIPRDSTAVAARFK